MNASPALAAARESRSTGRAELATPARLYDLADGDRVLYLHAMIEAGHIVPVDGQPGAGEPYKVCPKCQFKFEEPNGQGGLF